MTSIDGTLFRWCSLMSLFFFLLLLSLCVEATVSSDVNIDVICSMGWSGRKVTVPPERINDGYCDCPIDGGMDEPHTNACSGSYQWAGIPSPSELEEETIPPSSFYQCPLQPSIQLPLSRINDGVCDCCDGSDEKFRLGSGCVDICDQVLAEERAARNALRAKYEQGATRRTKEWQLFQQLYHQATLQLQGLESQKASMQEELVVAQQRLDDRQKLYVQQRRTLVLDLASSMTTTTKNGLGGFLSVLDQNELSDLILGLCQISHIHTIQTGNGIETNECEALQKAAYDLGFRFTPSSLLDRTAQNLDELQNGMLWNDWKDTLLFHKNGKVNLSESNPKKVKERVESDYNDDDDYEYGDYDDDYLVEEREEIKSKTTPISAGSTTEQPNSITSTTSRLIIPREFTKTQAESILKKIDSILNDNDDEDEVDNDTPSEGEKSEDDVHIEQVEIETEIVDIDPMLIQQVKTHLTKLLDTIWIEEETVSDTKTKLEIFFHTPDITEFHFRALVAGVIYHSFVTLEDLMDVLFHVLSPGSGSTNNPNRCDVDTDAQCLSSPDYAHAFHKNNVDILSPDLLARHNKRCRLRQERLPPSSNPETCTTTDATIPTELYDGFLNFYEFQRRIEDTDNYIEIDPIAQHFSVLSVFTNQTNFNNEEMPLMDLQSRLENLESQTKKLTDSIGIQDDSTGSGSHPKYGPHGELYALREQCYETEVGKYIYEICMHGKAYQRELKSKSKTGTSLGNWKGYTVSSSTTNDNDDATTITTLEYTGGLKCWNGPSRSASVVLTCGGDHVRLVHAEEPETCRYVMTLETYTACDENFAKAHGLL